VLSLCPHPLYMTVGYLLDDHVCDVPFVVGETDAEGVFLEKLIRLEALVLMEWLQLNLLPDDLAVLFGHFSECHNLPPKISRQATKAFQHNAHGMTIADSIR